MSTNLQNAIIKNRFREALNKYLEIERNVLKCLESHATVVYDTEERLVVSQVILYNLIRLVEGNKDGDLINNSHEQKLEIISTFTDLENYINTNQTVVLPPYMINVLKTTYRIALDILTKEEQKSDPMYTTQVFEQSKDFFMFLGNKLQQYVYGSLIIIQLLLSCRLFQRLHDITLSATRELSIEKDATHRWKGMYNEAIQWKMRINEESLQWKTMYERINAEFLRWKSNSHEINGQDEEAMSTTPAPANFHLAEHPTDKTDKTIPVPDNLSTSDNYQQKQDQVEQPLGSGPNVDADHFLASNFDDVDVDELDNTFALELDNETWDWDWNNSENVNKNKHVVSDMTLCLSDLSKPIDLMIILDIISMYRTICGIDTGSIQDEITYLESVINEKDITKIMLTKYFTIAVELSNLNTLALKSP